MLPRFLLIYSPQFAQASMPGLTGAINSDNKFYLLRARPLRAKDALVAQAGRLFLCSSGRRSGHILACSEDTASQNVKVKPALCESEK